MLYCEIFYKASTCFWNRINAWRVSFDHFTIFSSLKVPKFFSSPLSHNNKYRITHHVHFRYRVEAGYCQVHTDEERFSCWNKITNYHPSLRWKGGASVAWKPSGKLLQRVGKKKIRLTFVVICICSAFASRLPRLYGYYKWNVILFTLTTCPCRL